MHTQRPTFPAIRHAPARAASGFSLVELLAVIAIVASLGAILTPVISQATISARKAESISQLGGCYKALMLLGTDNGGALPLAYSTELDGRGRPYGTWYNQLVRDRYLDVPPGTSLTQLPVFGCNQQLAQFPKAATKATFSMNARVGNSASVPGAHYFNEIQEPSDLMLLCSGVANAAGTSFNSGVYEDYATRVQPPFGEAVLIAFADGNIQRVSKQDIPTQSWNTAQGRRFWYGN